MRLLNSEKEKGYVLLKRDILFADYMEAEHYPEYPDYLILSFGHEDEDSFVIYQRIAIPYSRLEELIALLDDQREKIERARMRKYGEMRIRITKRICPECGFENSPDAIFCANCGAKLE